MAIESKPWNQFDNRCERCGSESWVKFDRIISLNEVETHVQEFFFCGHHGRKHSTALTSSGWAIEDYSELIALTDPALVSRTQ